MKKSRIFLSALTALSVVPGCQQETVLQERQPREIKLTTTFDVTKATATAFEDGDEIGLTIGTPVSVDNVKLTPSGVNLLPESTLYWPAHMEDDATASFVAYYPYDFAGKYNADGTEVGPVDVTADYAIGTLSRQNKLETYQKQDLMSAVAVASPSDESVELHFKHLMARLNLTVVDNLQTDSFTPILGAMNVAVNKLNARYIVNFGNQTLSAHPEPWNTLSLYPLYMGADTYSLLLPAQTVSPEIVLTLDSGKTITYVATSPITFSSGKQVSATLTISEDQISLSYQIEDWTDDPTEIKFTQDVSQQTPPNNEIWYKTADGNPITTISSSAFGSAEIVSNEYDKERDVCILSLSEDAIYLGPHFLGEDATKVVWISLPEGIRDIRDYAFEGCSFESITIPESVEFVGSLNPFTSCNKINAFYGKYATEDHLGLIKDNRYISFAFGANIDTYNVPNSVKEINTYAFYHSNLKEIILPEGLETIDEMAFRESSIENVILPSTLKSIGSYAFYLCNSLTELTIPDSIEELGTNPVSCARNFEYFYGKYATADHRALIKDGKFIALASSGVSEYEIPEGVHTIRREAIFDFELKTLIIPSSVTSMEDVSVFHISQGASIYVLAAMPPEGTYSMLPHDYSPSSIFAPTIYVPTESVEAYKSAEGWRHYADRIVPIE